MAMRGGRHEASLASRLARVALHEIPQDPLGPDALIQPQPRLWPATDTVAFHYPHPVTGKPTDLGKLQIVKAAAGDTPVFLGSGVTAKSIASFHPHADGFIVGTAFKEGGDFAKPVDVQRVKDLIAAL